MVLFFFSCQKTEQLSKEEKDLLLISRQKTLDDKVYLLFGLQGCGACLDHTVNFVSENIKNDKIVFIVSDKSKSKINALFGEDMRLKKNFIVDSTMNAYILKMLGTGYPKAFLCKKNKILDSFEISYMNSKEQFSRLKLYANEK
jgi:hypothetical protein